MEQSVPDEGLKKRPGRRPDEFLLIDNESCSVVDGNFFKATAAVGSPRKEKVI